MLNKLIIISILLGPLSICAQQIEANSRPYRFNIDKMMYLEGYSEVKKFSVEPCKNKLRMRLEQELAMWYQQHGYAYNDKDSYEAHLTEAIDELKPIVIHEVGVESMELCSPDWFYLPEKLEFEIQFDEFKPFNLYIPLSEVESFKVNFEKLEFSDHRIAYDEDEEFVVTYIEIYNPELDRTYVFYNTDEGSVVSPPLTVSLPEFDL